MATGRKDLSHAFLYLWSQFGEDKMCLFRVKPEQTQTLLGCGWTMIVIVFSLLCNEWIPLVVLKPFFQHLSILLASAEMSRSEIWAVGKRLESILSEWRDEENISLEGKPESWNSVSCSSSAKISARFGSHWYKMTVNNTTYMWGYWNVLSPPRKPVLYKMILTDSNLWAKFIA